MDLALVIKEIEISLVKVVRGGVQKSQTELGDFKLTVYKVGGVIRIDIKERLNS
uniref:Uncharacterized protein n=1 Tax=viral metagenome TaxID=1070528 RepID=A0A6M3KRJ5_9ZZZZ